jgi:hypothetical protein
MYTTSLFQIDGVDMPAPDSGIPYTSSNLQSSGYRDTLGILHKTTVRYDTKKVELNWGRLHAAEVKKIYDAIYGKEWFVFRFYNPLVLGMSTCTVYNGDLTFNVETIIGNGEDAICTEIKLSCIQQ